jgi:hypothetical protein
MYTSILLLSSQSTEVHYEQGRASMTIIVTYPVKKDFFLVLLFRYLHATTVTFSVRSIPLYIVSLYRKPCSDILRQQRLDGFDAK